MNFEWPLFFITLLIPLLLAIGYWLTLRRRNTHVIDYTSLTLIRAAQPSKVSWKRHIPAVMFLLSLVALSVGTTRPMISTEVPLSRTSIILTLDVSLSMCSTDVEPNRLAVAQDAARQFVTNRDDGTQIGIVVFGGTAELVVPPTNNTADLVQAVDGFTTSLGTGIGNATITALDAIANVNPDVERAAIDLSGTVDRDAIAASGEFQPDIVVLLTDGANSQGVDPLLAAQQAFDRQVRVYTIGFGGDQIAEMVCAPDQIGPGSFAPGFTFNDGVPDLGDTSLDELRQFLVIDEATLIEVAESTGGEYFRAEDSSALQDVFEQLPSQIELQEQEVEVTVAFLIAGVVLMLAAYVASTLVRS